MQINHFWFHLSLLLLLDLLVFLLPMFSSQNPTDYHFGGVPLIEFHHCYVICIQMISDDDFKEFVFPSIKIYNFILLTCICK